MKRLFLLITLTFIALGASAQKHMSFMGIPLDGHINTFTSKLRNKGATLHPDNKYLSTGSRLFKGTYYDQDADILVSYNAKTGIVYQARVTILGDSESTLVSLQKEIENIVKIKYIYIDSKGKTRGGDDINIYEAYWTDDDEYPYGRIYLGTCRSSDDFYDYELNITYEDARNSVNNLLGNADDI